MLAHLKIFQASNNLSLSWAAISQV